MSSRAEKRKPTSIGLKQRRLKKVAALVVCVVVFVLAIFLMSMNFSLMGADMALGLIEAASNPFVALFVGILITALFQSSSTTTSLVVAMVASGTLGSSTDPDTISRVIPFILGANIGTAVTSSMVALGHISSRREYRKAIAAATVHDIFNIVTVLILFPLELLFGVLSRPAAALTSWIHPGATGNGGFGFTDSIVRPVAESYNSLLGMFANESWVPTLGLLTALLLLFLSLRWLNKLLKENLILPGRDTLGETVFRTPWTSLGWGTLVTAFVQSSSVVTSLLVPLVATDKISMSKAFPFIMGANVGTTTTALFAAIVVTGSNPGAALAIAVAHLLFNLVGVLLIFPIERVRMFPVMLARRLGHATLSNRLVGILYILLVFFLVPFIMVVLSGGTGQ